MNTNSYNLNAIVTRLLDVAIDLRRLHADTKDGAHEPSSLPENDGSENALKAGLAGVARRILKEADDRSRFFDEELFSDPVWHILLDLYAHEAERRRVTVSDACVAARVPPTTALRWIANLIDQGLVEKIADPHDRRRFHVHLSRAAFEAMSHYLAGISGIEAAVAPIRPALLQPICEADRSIEPRC